LLYVLDVLDVPHRALEVTVKLLSFALAILLLSAAPLMAGGSGGGTDPIAVPEPTTIALIVGGAGMLGVSAWRRRKGR
jgi:hypothetical protein